MMTLFQYKEEKIIRASPVYYIGVSIGAGVAVSFVLVICFICWWNKQKRPHLKEHKFQYRGKTGRTIID